MELREAILGRRSIRAFGPGAVPDAARAAFEEALRWAPSAGNVQGRTFYFVTNEAVKARLGASSFQAPMFEAAALVVVGSTHPRIRDRYGERGTSLYAQQDVAAAVQNLLLTVHAHGLGAVWVGAFDPARVRDVLGLDEGRVPVVMVPIGRPAEAPEAPARLPREQLFVDVP